LLTQVTGQLPEPPRAGGGERGGGFRERDDVPVPVMESSRRPAAEHYQFADYPSTDDRVSLRHHRRACSHDPRGDGMARASDSRSRSRAAAGSAVLPPSMRDRVPFLLYRAAEESHALANQMLADMALTARQAGILTMVTELEPMTQKALGEALRIDRTTMVALLDDLED